MLKRQSLVFIRLPYYHNADESKRFLETISDAVRRFKSKYVAPYFIIAGDFNRRKIASELKEFGDLKLVKTGPTRGKNTLDLIFTNYPEMIKEYDTLFNHEGVQSDHLAVHLMARMPRVANYKIQKYTCTSQTPEGDKMFSDKLNEAPLHEIEKQNDPSAMVDQLHDLFKQISAESYETKISVEKSNQPQGINKHVLDLIARRKVVYRREKRSQE